MKKLALLVLCIGFLTSAKADYLEIRRNANIKETPESDGVVLYKAIPGEYVILLDYDQQFNGYYFIETTDGVQGYVYRTLVRRYRGSIPVVETTTDISNDIYGVGQIPPGYYSGTATLEGEALKKQLHRIVRNHTVFSYDDLWDILAVTDQDPANESHLILLYTGRSQSTYQRDRGTRYDYEAHGYTLNDSWNREHVWAKSHGFPDEGDTAYTDLHHLRPADRSTNSARNTRSFDFGTEQYFDNAGTISTDCYKSDNWTWEPPDNVKGDVARMIFYMAVRYEVPEMDLEVVDFNPEKGSKEPIMGNLSTLLRWNKEDPVDNWERRRNHIIYEDYQGNRNPFIDHPEWVGSIWE